MFRACCIMRMVSAYVHVVYFICIFWGIFLRVLIYRVDRISIKQHLEGVAMTYSPAT